MQVTDDIPEGGLLPRPAPANGRDYFTVMGLPRRLSLDPRQLEPVFHSLSRRFHPDLYRMASSRERLAALEASALVNQAYRTLRDPFDRAEYLVKLETAGLGEQTPAAPAALFEEILEVQELLGDLRFAAPGEAEAIRDQLACRQTDLQAEHDRLEARLTGPVFARWDALPEGGSDDRALVLEEIRRILGERAYLRRVLGSLAEALGASPRGEP